MKRKRSLYGQIFWQFIDVYSALFKKPKPANSLGDVFCPFIYNVLEPTFRKQFSKTMLFSCFTTKKRFFFLFFFKQRPHAHPYYLFGLQSCLSTLVQHGRQRKANLQPLAKKTNAVTVGEHIMLLGHVITEAFFPKHILFSCQQKHCILQNTSGWRAAEHLFHTAFTII